MAGTVALNVGHGRLPAGGNFAPPLDYFAPPSELLSTTVLSFFLLPFFVAPVTFLAPALFLVPRASVFYTPNSFSFARSLRWNFGAAYNGQYEPEGPKEITMQSILACWESEFVGPSSWKAFRVGAYQRTLHISYWCAEIPALYYEIIICLSSRSG